MVTKTASLRTFSKNEPLVHKRRTHIAISASRIFVKKGYEKTTMQDIARECGMGIGSLYYYVGSKKDLVYLILELTHILQSQRLQKIAADFNGLSPSQSLPRYIRLYLEHVDELQDLYIFLNHVVLSMERSERRLFFESTHKNWELFSDLLAKGNDLKEFNVPDPEFVGRSIISVCNSWALLRWSLRKKYTLKEYADNTVETFVAAVSGAGYIAAARERLADV